MYELYISVASCIYGEPSKHARRTVDGRYIVTPEYVTICVRGYWINVWKANWGRNPVGIPTTFNHGVDFAFLVEDLESSIVVALETGSEPSRGLDSITSFSRPEKSKPRRKCMMSMAAKSALKQHALRARW